MRAWIFAGLVACGAAPDLQAVKTTADKTDVCVGEAHVAYDACLQTGGSPGPFCNKSARDAYDACKKREGLP